jgi:preprotein translocase subunit SecA
VDIYAEGIKPEEMNRQELGDSIFDKLKERYDAKEKLIGADAMRYHERTIMLSVIDAQWKDHLLSMDHLKEGIGLRGYGQHDPLVSTERILEMFEDMMQRFRKRPSNSLPDADPERAAPAPAGGHSGAHCQGAESGVLR